MEFTSTFVKEHYLIEQVLNCLEKMVERCESQKQLEREQAQDAVRFLRGFVERCYYIREQTHLLPAMRAMNISPEACLGCSMLQRHHEGIEHVEAMESSIDPASAGDAVGLSQFARHANGYIELLLQYIARQEDCLFPMLSRDPDWIAAPHPMLPLEQEDGDADQNCTHETYVELAQHLAEHFGVPKVKDEQEPTNVAH